MAKAPKEIPVEVVPYIRYGDQWIKVSDLTTEQIAYLRESIEKVLPANATEMMARAWDLGFAAGHDAGVLDEDRPTNPFHGPEAQRG